MLNFLRPKRIIQKVKFKKTELLGVRLKPAKQLESTCWFYSIVNLIKHSPILRNNIAYSVAMHQELRNAAQNARNRPDSKNSCSKQELYYRTLKMIAGNKVNNAGLANFISKMSGRVLHNVYKTNMSKERPTNVKSEIRSKLLNRGAYTHEQFKVLKELLNRLKLPSDVISKTPKPGYTHAGALLEFNMYFRTINSPHSAHAVIGTYSRMGVPKVLNSAHPAIYNINWTKSMNEVNAQFRNKWSTIPWSNNANFRGLYRKTDIYVKKLY